MPTRAPTPTIRFLTASRPHGSISMIKDIIVHLEHQAARDPAHDFAVTIAETFDAHLAAVAFAYAPVFPGYVMLEIPADIVAGLSPRTRRRLWPRSRCRAQAHT